MFQTINHQRVSSQLLLVVVAALLAVSVYVAVQLAAAGTRGITAPFQAPAQIQAPASGPAIDYNSTHIREFRGGRPF